MADSSRTTPSGATRAEEEHEASVEPGAQAQAGDEDKDAPDEVSADVAEHYEDMIERGAQQRGEGRLP